MSSRTNTVALLTTWAAKTSLTSQPPPHVLPRPEGILARLVGELARRSRLVLHPWAAAIDKKHPLGSSACQSPYSPVAGGHRIRAVARILVLRNSAVRGSRRSRHLPVAECVGRRSAVELQAHAETGERGHCLMMVNLIVWREARCGRAAVVFKVLVHIAERLVGEPGSCGQLTQRVAGNLDNCGIVAGRVVNSEPNSGFLLMNGAAP